MANRRNSSSGARRRNVRTSRRSSGMTRGRFLRTAGIGAAAVGAAAVGLGGVASAIPPDDNIDDSDSNDIKVHPIGNPNRDPVNVQWAVNNVDNGGTVTLLKAKKNGLPPHHFNFGKDGTVKIRKSVTITGEKDEENNPETKIKGGYPAFQAPYLNDGGEISAEFTVKHIHFVGPRMSAVAVHTCQKANILDNVIESVSTGIVPSYELPPVFSGRGRYAILVNDGSLYGLLPSKGSIGSVDVKRNYIDNIPKLPVEEYAMYSAGVLVLNVSQKQGGKLNVVDNEIDNPGHAGVHIAGTSSVEVTVENNVINQIHRDLYGFENQLSPPSPDFNRDALYPLRAGEGIRVLSDLAFGGNCKKVDVIDNDIYDVSTSGITAKDIRYAAFGCEGNPTYDLRIFDNEITMTNGRVDSRGIYIGHTKTDLGGDFTGSDHVHAADNRISGDAQYGFYVEGGDVNEYSRNNRIDIQPGELLNLTLTGSGYHVFLASRTECNLVNLNASGYTHIDNGVLNIINL
jgi:hypothetical protein